MTRRYLERVAVAAPFGVRFRDVVDGHFIDDVSVRLVPVPAGAPVQAVRTPSGVFAVHGVRSLRPWSRPDIDRHGIPIRATAPTLPHRLEVRDDVGRYHSFAVDVTLPTDGLLKVACASPPAQLTGSDVALPMFPLPSHRVPAVTAVVRARLAHPDGTPAVHAALDVVPASGTRTARGIADQRGEVVVMFPYPPPVSFRGSPPAVNRKGLAHTTWQVTVRANVPAVASPPSTGDLVDLCQLLDQIPTTLKTTTSPPAELGEQTLTYGRELVLRSSPDDATLLVGA